MSAKPVAGMHLFYLDEAGVLFSAAKQELHLLNTSGALIWSLLEEGHDEVTASTALGGLCGLDLDRSRQYVVAAIAEWRALGFLQGSGSALPAPPPSPAKTVNPKPPALGAEIEFTAARYYRIRGTTIRMRFSCAAQFGVVHPIVEHLEVQLPATAAAAIDIVGSASALTVYRDQQAYATCGSIDQLAPIVKSLVWAIAVDSRDFFLDVHAGVVGDGARCLLLPAPSGSGKSTLTALLVRAGYQFYSDEVALLEEGSLDVYPVPLAMGVKESGIEALAGAFPALRELPMHRRGDGKRVAYLTPPRTSLPTSDAAKPVFALVFPRFTPNAKTALYAMGKPGALKHLLDECLMLRSPLTVKSVGALVGWISRIGCYGLTYASAESALAEIDGVFDRPQHGASND